VTKQTHSTLYRSFDQPDQQETFPNGTLDLVSLADQQVGRITFESGWRYSESSLQANSQHLGVITQGSMHIQEDGGEQYTVEAPSVVSLRPGIDAWTDGPCEMIDFSNPREFAGTGTSR
jgi:hypothetical protein